MHGHLPSLMPHRLYDRVPHSIYTGAPAPPPQVFVWRSCALEKATGHIIAFYRDDAAFMGVWHRPAHYLSLFVQHGVAAVGECDFSLWLDDSQEDQREAVRRARWLGRYWQEHGLWVVPSLNWGGPETFSFAFHGVPVGCPLVMVECRTPGSNDTDRRAFLAGLVEAVQQAQPARVVIYGGQEHSFWLSGRLPPGPRYMVLPSWQTARRHRLRDEARQARDRNQFALFSRGGRTVWAAEDRREEITPAV